MSDSQKIIVEKVDLLLAELVELRSRGPHFRIRHRFGRIAGCSPGEEISVIILVHRGREYCLHLPLALRLLFDYLARHSRFPQSAGQIEVGIRANPFYTEHASAVMGKTKFTRRIPRSAVRVYVQRLRIAIADAMHEAGLQIDPLTIVVSQETVMKEVGYRLKATFEWVHIERSSD